ncbi:MAG TPA: hypothetical protein VMV29_03680 [Ktedonobacterales bacterium]|nr:hypothetical protein [Ktedonobacterales bacterium]
MGEQLIESADTLNLPGASQTTLLPALSAVPWLDAESAALVTGIVESVVTRHADLSAAILFGSVARHEERPLDDPAPSDVDLLLLFDSDPMTKRMSLDRRLAISHSIGLGMDRRLHAPREVNVVTGMSDLSDWSDEFVGSVTHDGILLWARGALPSRLARLELRNH